MTVESSSADTEGEAEDEVEPSEQPVTPMNDLTDIPATVIAEAVVRVRPGLPWPALDHLSAGDEVVVLNHAGGWFRIRFGGGQQGWIRVGDLEIGELKPWWFLNEPASIIVAAWREDQYGVMGRSADGAEVRLLPLSEEVAEDEVWEYVSAPIDEVTLLADDITVRDLPIVIGDETVVFPGDDFQVGQGRILPKANEWMWLPWGWLLAQNDTHIWVWRPETDVLEFTPRPPGQAKFSPDGQFLAIATCRDFDPECWQDPGTIILPLDGTEPISSRERIRSRWPGLEFRIGFGRAGDLQWTSDSMSVLVPISVRSRTTEARTVMRTPGSYAQPMALLTTDGEVTLFTHVLAEHVGRDDCYYAEYSWQSWRLREDDTVGIYVFCHSAEDSDYFYVIYDLNGALLRLEPWRDPSVETDRSQEIRAADDRRALGETLQIGWAPSNRYAIVVSEESRDMWLYDSSTQELTLIAREGRNTRISADWGRPDWDVYWYGDSFAGVLPTYIASFASAVISVAVEDGSASIFDIGRINGLPCRSKVSRSPDGKQMHVAFQLNDIPESGTVRVWIDGASIRYWSLGQHLIIGTANREASILRSIAFSSFRSAFHRAEWSPGGKWWVIGGNHERAYCSLGP